VLALASTAWAGVVAVLEDQGHLPAQLGPYTPYNALSALGFTLLMTTLLVQSSLGSLRALHARAAESARARDEALQRSIHAQKMELVGNLTNGIAHDFNNLLTVISNAAALLRGARATEPERAALLDDLDAATLRATLITRQLLSFGKAEGTLQPVDLAAVVRSLESMLPRLLGAGITVVADAPAPVPVRATRSGLEQILLNLSVNARDAMPTGGTLTLRAERATDGARLTVTDTGVGMDSETRARAFDAFFTTKPTGTGVGLATVRTLVERFGGSVTAQSAPGAGATFVVLLPALAGELGERAALPEPAPQRAPKPGQARVLVVEDDALVRRATTRTLERTGHDVVAVANGVEALALLEHTRDFAVVVSDVLMPELDGEELARRLATLYPSLPVVLMSGNRQPGDDVLAAPGRAFVEKPATVEALLAAIAHARRGS
jgi:signal transduction histidine kinase